ncbi:MAG TPA: signal peptide peptidase SppA [Candidatus Binatia bacterium]|jgi:protease-4|nr:signal peptide peptidase SppA [Candidatus Binatia bacterium]
MKTLLRIVWKIIKVGLFAIGALLVLGILLLIGAVLLAPAAHKIADKSVLVFNLDTQLTNRPPDESAAFLSRLFGNRASSLQLRAATTALHEAAQDKRISGLYLHGNLVAAGYSSGYGALKELREAIQDFQKSGKPVIAYIAAADNRDYYLMSVADQILLNPLGLIAFRGLSAHGVFYKGAGDKYGIEFTPIRHGKYKSAIEPFIRQDFSPENRQQLDALIKTLWGEMLNAVAASRKLTPDKLQALADQEGLITVQTAKANGLVTELASEGQALDKLRQLTGKTAGDEPFPQVSLADYADEAQALAARKQHGKDKIAVVYAEGVIVDGEGEPMSDGQVAAEPFARMIRKLQRRKDVKAVVLRVNSPGGSAEASEAMLAELRRFKSDRPVIVSMGTVAASGGYFISTAARRIIAEPNTITGSIGVFGLGLNVKKLANDHGITFDAVKTGALADLGTISRPMTPQEQAVLQNFVDHVYGVFVQHVAECRNLTTNRVDELAQGRVWSGADALKVGLVDQLGGLRDAIGVAAKEAKLGANYSVVEFPEQKPLLEGLSEALGGERPPLAKHDLAGRITQQVVQGWRWLSSFNAPHGVYARLPFELELN